jgi:hypothetical protein
MKKKLMNIISKDAAFFAKNNIIDYSLLIGVHIKSQHKSPTNQSRLNSVESDFGSSPLQVSFHDRMQGDRFSTTSIM